MKDKTLQQRLENLFTPVNELVPFDDDPEEGAASGLTLDALFSETDEPELATAPAEPVPPPAQTRPAANSPEPAPPPHLPRPESAAVALRPVTSRSLAPHAPHSIASREEQLLDSGHPDDRYLAVQQLGTLRQPWTIVPLLQAAADSDRDVAWSAIQGLLSLKQQVVRFILAQVHQPATLLHQGGTAFLSHLLGQPLVFIPPGPFLMGSHPALDPLATPYEQPQHELLLPGFWLMRYPVTTAKFFTFVNESGYRPGDNGWRHGPVNHPVVGLTWYDALAYSDWLSRRSGLNITLPSEAQWEKAARGTDGRHYPWGNQPPEPDLCRFEATSPVGHFSPQGDSPYGCADMAGNVWEWTRSAFYAYPYRPDDGREQRHEKEPRVIRGSTFNNIIRFARCTFRYSLDPEQLLPSLGFRLAVVSPIQLGRS